MSIFIMDPAEELTSEKLQEFIESFQARLPRYEKLKNMYMGKHGILFDDEKDPGKPDNRLVVNFAKYIVDTLNGYFIGNPIKTVHPDEDTADRMKVIAKRNSQNDNNAELSKMCSIYGHAYEYVYQDEESNTRVTYLSPQSGFVIYDDSVAEEPLYGVRMLTDGEGKAYGVVYSKNGGRGFRTVNTNITMDEKEEPHYYNDIPLIEYVENEERQSAFENVETLINAYNKALSEKANDVDYFADAYLAILGVELDENTIKNIRDNRVINLKDGDVNKIIVEFLDKPNADETQENLINRLETLIFQTSMVANINDESFGVSSGISLKYKLQSMENITLMKERKFNNGMNRRFKMMFNVPMNFSVGAEGYLDIDYVFTRNIPNNTVEEADTVQKLTGIVSHKTLLSILSSVDNVQDELDEIEREKEEKAVNAFTRDMNTSFGKDVTDDEKE